MGKKAGRRAVNAESADPAWLKIPPRSGELIIKSPARKIMRLQYVKNAITEQEKGKAAFLSRRNKRRSITRH